MLSNYCATVQHKLLETDEYTCHANQRMPLRRSFLSKNLRVSLFVIGREPFFAAKLSRGVINPHIIVHMVHMVHLQRLVGRILPVCIQEKGRGNDRRTDGGGSVDANHLRNLVLVFYILIL